MKHKLQKIKEESVTLAAEASAGLQTAGEHLDQIIAEQQRVNNYSRAPMALVEEIDQQFEQATQLTGVDVSFLFVAVALQCLRQYLLTRIPERLDDKAAADAVKGHREHSDRSHRLYNPSLVEIIANPVPFDATMGAAKYSALEGFGALGHRGATPGHDPLFGLLFGTANIATSTLTNWRMESFHIYSGAVGAARGVHDVFYSRAQTPLVFSYTFDKLMRQGWEGKQIVGVSLCKEIIHLRSDVHSKNSLPLPAISAIDPNLAGELAARGLDTAMVLDVGKQFAYAAAIDALIGMIHGLFYDPSSGMTRSMYEVRTRHILLYSNLIATSSNVVTAAVMQYMGMDGTRVIDWGGYLNTVRHIACDVKFIHEIKRDFLKNGLYNCIVGPEYDFMKGEV